MRYGQIRTLDVANGPGIRVSFFVTGCHFKCKGCFNQLYQDFHFGELWTSTQTQQVIQALMFPYIEGLTVLGGEPFQNTKDLYPILKEIKSSMRSDQNIWIYSGYTLEQILEDVEKKELLSLCDVLVDGLFECSKKDLKLKFRGSSNQRILDIQKSLILGESIELKID